MWKIVALKVVTRVLCALPRAFCYAFARAIGSALSVLPTSRRRALTSNIAIARDACEGDAAVRRDTRRAFQHAMLNYVDLFRLARPDAAEAVRAIEVTDWRPFDEANALGKGVILISAHLGNFDMVVQKLPLHGIRTLIPVEPMEPPELLEEVRKHRAALGTDIVPIGLDTFKLLSAHVRSGGTAVIVSDRDIQGTGYQVELFGRRVCLPQAAIVLALRTGAPVLGAFGYRHGDNRITGRFVPALQFAGATAPMTQTGGSGKRSFKDDLDSGMRALSVMLEREIGRDPGQWVVQQPIFAPDPSSRRTIVSAARWHSEMRRALKALARAVTRGHAVRSR